MPLQPCAPSPFVGTQQFEVPIGTTIMQAVRTAHGGGSRWTLTICRRPFVPLYGVYRNANTLVTTYDFAPSTKDNQETLVGIAATCLAASVAYKNDTALPNASYTPGDGPNYGTYLIQKVPSDCVYKRYIEVYNKAKQYFDLKPGPIVWNLTTYNELTALTEKVMRESDKQMFIAPGTYIFDTGSIANTLLDAWLAGDATWQGELFGLELVLD